MRLRLKFTKLPPLTYIGHLDLMRYFQKVFRRANVPVKFSDGFSPHIIMSFALPLGVGVRSVGDYLDLSLNDDDTMWIEKQYLNKSQLENYKYDPNKLNLSFLNDILKNINKECQKECFVTGINVVPENKKNKAMTLVDNCDYFISIPYPSTDIFERDKFMCDIEEYLSNEIVFEKKTKKGIEEKNFTSALFEYRLCYFDEIKFDNDKIFHAIKFFDESNNYKIFGEKYINNTIDEFTEDYIAKEEKGNLGILLRLKSGSENNLNPKLLFENFYNKYKYVEDLFKIYRLEMYSKSGRLLDTIVE